MSQEISPLSFSSVSAADTPIPFMVSNKGYGVFVNTTYRSNWRLDSLGLRKDLDIQNNSELSAYSFEVPFSPTQSLSSWS